MDGEERSRFTIGSVRNYQDIVLEDEDRLWTDEELDLFEQQEEEFQQRANELTQRINNFILSLVCSFFFSSRFPFFVQKVGSMHEPSPVVRLPTGGSIIGKGQYLSPSSFSNLNTGTR